MAGANPSEPVPVKVATSDLPKRAASAVVMLAVAGAALWLGGVVLQAFIALVALACFVEFVLLLVRSTPNVLYRVPAVLAGACYIAVASHFLAKVADFNRGEFVALVGAVICVDVFAYFFGRTIGGPKIAPRISPSKTWAGLLGGIVGASAFALAYGYLWQPICEMAITLQEGSAVVDRCYAEGEADLVVRLSHVLPIGAVIAVLAQSGDFFESWLKRRAGKKDSSNIIPGHGGVFDRVDGLLAVAFFFGVGTYFGP